MKIIITDAESRKSFDVINILHNVYGFQTILFANKDFSFQLPLIYGEPVHRLRCENYSSFREDFFPIVSKYENEKLIYLAVAEKPTQHFYAFIRDFDLPNLHYLLPEKSAFNLTRNKAAFQEFCEKHGFPVPRSFDQRSIATLRQEFLPVIAKRRVGAGSVGMRYIESPEQLSELGALNLDDYLIQERILSDQKVSGGFFLCHKGDTVGYYGHRRLRTFPSEGGVTVYSKSEDCPEIRKIGEKVLKELKWEGFAMIEFIQDKLTDEWKIIELNPRLWGSIMLSEFCGSAFLNKYINLCQGKEIKGTLAKDQKFIRWLFPFDLLNWLSGKINSKEFFRLDTKQTCYINFTYSSFRRATLFLVYFSINFSSIRRFSQKFF